MYKQPILCLLLCLLIGQPAWSGCCRRSCGQAPNHGKFVQRSNASLSAWKQSDAVQTQAIQQYTKLGSKLESEKKWADAEKSFRYVLQVVSLRDGPGSYASVPALEHLVTIEKAQNKINDATSYQEIALALRQAQPKADQQAILNAQLNLGDLYIKQQNYREAASVLKDSIAMYNSQPTLNAEKRLATYQQYANVLRQQHKDSEADAIEAAAETNNPQSESLKLAESKQIPTSQDSPSVTSKSSAVVIENTGKQPAN